jgi:hypothetical protein
VEEDLGIDQGWNVDSELGDDSRVEIISHQEVLVMTLRDRIDDVDDADHSGPSRRTNFSQSTGNSANNSNATTWLHTRWATALKTIALVDKNYALENDLYEAQAQMAAIVAQNKLLQEQLSGSHHRVTVASEYTDPDSPLADPLTHQLLFRASGSTDGANDSSVNHNIRKETEPQLLSSGLLTDKDVPIDVEEGEAMQIRGGGAPLSASHPSPAGSVLFYVDDTDRMGDTGTGLPFFPHLLFPRSWAPLAQGSGTSLTSWLTSKYPVPSPEGPANCAPSRLSSHTHQNHVSSLSTGNGGSKVGGEENY